MNRVHKTDYRVVMDTLSSLDCPRSLTVAILWRYQEYDQIVSQVFDPLAYNDCDEARLALTATDLLRKHEDLPTNFDKEARAHDAFRTAELDCKTTNDRLRTSNSCAAQLFIAQRKIGDVLGVFNPDEWLELSGWGPGVTLTLRGSSQHPINKFHHQGEATEPLTRFIRAVWPTQFPTWDLSKLQSYEGNRVITVPKNAKIDRVIAVEPSINLYLQKGVGTMIRKRMSRFGVDLNDQTVNQELARSGSSTGRLATIDFSAASDTLAYQLVLDLLPFKWLQVMDLLRSPRGVINDGLVTYEKFSSMGNGFTWELESLIFWALALAVVPRDHPERHNVSVYGDDVIIPSDCVEQYVALCNHCGFTINTSKSYDSTYYRESCGGHYWNGVDITPIYMRRYLRGQEVMKFHNRLQELAGRFGAGICKDIRFKPICMFLRSLGKYPLVPTSLGDTGFYGEFDEVRPALCRKYQRGFNVKHLSFIPEKFEAFHVGVLLTRLTQFGNDRPENNTGAIPRAGKTRLITSFVLSWSSFGPWCKTHD